MIPNEIKRPLVLVGLTMDKSDKIKVAKNIDKNHNLNVEFIRDPLWHMLIIKT